MKRNSLVIMSAIGVLAAMIASTPAFMTTVYAQVGEPSLGEQALASAGQATEQAQTLAEQGQALAEQILALVGGAG